MKVLILDFIQALRSMRRHAWQSVLSIVGIAVGTACLALTANWLWTENNYDSFRRGYRDIYALQADSTAFGPSTTLTFALEPQLDSLIAGKIPYAITRNADNCIGATSERGSMFEKTIIESTPGIGEALNVKVVKGSLASALQSDAGIALTEHMAQLLFGKEEALGRKVFVCSNYSEPREFTVAAIIGNCGKSNIYYDALKAIEKQSWYDQWGSCNFHIFLRTADADEALRLVNEIEQPKDYCTTYSLRPIRTLHQSADLGEGFLNQNFYPFAFCFIAALLLLAAVVNLITIFTSIFLGRTREYALRRSLGARRRQNVRWICTSVVPPLLVAFAAGLAGLMIVLHFNPILGGHASIYRFFFAIATATFVACLAGMLYPVWKLEKAYRLSLGYGVAERENSHAWLLLVQSFVCALLLFISIGMQRQLYAMMNGNMGFSRNDILRLHTGRGWHPTVWNRDTQTQDLKVTERFSFRDIFWDLPAEIKAESAAVDGAVAMPFDIFNRNTGVSFPLIPATITTDEQEGAYYEKWAESNYQGEEVERAMVRYLEIPYGAFEFFHIKVDGDGLRRQDEQDGVLNVLMNAEARSRFHVDNDGLTDLRTGQWMSTVNSMTRGTEKHMAKQRLNVCGTFHLALNDFHNEVEPTIIAGVPERHECLFVNHDAVYVHHLTGRRAEAEEAIRRVLAKHEVPETAIIIESLADYIAYSYEDESFYARLISALSVLSVIITLSGVLSLLLYALRMRRRSIAIRRVHGAGFRHLFRSQLVPFLTYTAVGAVPAFVPSFLFMRKWMEYFHHGEAPGIGLAVAILVVMLALVVVIVFLQVRLSMKARPVEVLKPES